MASRFEDSLQMVLQHEGTNFVNDPADSGGASRYGISLRFYKRKIKPDATPDDIKNLTVNDAAEIYRRFWWDRYLFADINSQLICNRLFDLSVNMGAPTAISCLQKAANSCAGSHLVTDGMLGAKTLDAVNSIPEKILYDQLITQAKAFYNDLVAKNSKDKVFIKGWLARLAN